MNIDEAAVLAAQYTGKTVESLEAELLRRQWSRQIRHTMTSMKRFQTTYQNAAGWINEGLPIDGPRLIVWSEMTEKGAVTNVFAEVRDGRS